MAKDLKAGDKVKAGRYDEWAAGEIVYQVVLAEDGPLPATKRPDGVYRPIPERKGPAEVVVASPEPEEEA